MNEKIKIVLRYLKCLIIVFSLIFTAYFCLESLYNEYKTIALLDSNNVEITKEYSKHLEGEFNYTESTIKDPSFSHEKTILDSYEKSKTGTVLLVQEMNLHNNTIQKILLIFEVSVIVSLVYYVVTKSKKNQLKKLLVSNAILNISLLFINDLFNNSSMEDEQILFSITIIYILACLLLKLKDRIKHQKNNIDVLDKVYIIIIILSPLSYSLADYQITLLIISSLYLVLTLILKAYKFFKFKKMNKKEV